jgi:SAM-dependent methyltransferase
VNTQQFYDDLAPFYELVFEDWDASMSRQGAALERIIQAELAPGSCSAVGTRVLDVACGVGTQALALAARGFQVTGRDLSPGAVGRLQREAQARGLSIDVAVADMRHVADSVSTQFDAVVAFDNSIPHLLTDLDIRGAFTEFIGVLRPGGVCLCSVRDYDTVQRGVPATHSYGERRRGDEVFHVRQEWTWQGPHHYQIEFIIEQDNPAGPITVLRTGTRYYAVSVARLLELMAEAGFRDCRRLDGAIYQPVLIGRAA